jgi:hypothetical protein
MIYLFQLPLNLKIVYENCFFKNSGKMRMQLLMCSRRKWVKAIMGEAKVFTFSSFFLFYNSNQSIDYRRRKKRRQRE